MRTQCPSLLLLFSKNNLLLIAKRILKNLYSPKLFYRIILDSSSVESEAFITELKVSFKINLEYFNSFPYKRLGTNHFIEIPISNPNNKFSGWIQAPISRLSHWQVFSPLWNWSWSTQKSWCVYPARSQLSFRFSRQSQPIFAFQLDCITGRWISSRRVNPIRIFILHE